MIRSLVIVAVAVGASPGCSSLDCWSLPGSPDRCVPTADGADGSPPFELCDQDGACFDCGVGEVAIGIVPNGSGCDGELVCDGVEFRVDCEIGSDFVTESCACQIDRETVLTFSPTELCEAENVDTRALSECGWTLSRSE